ncbi:MAG: hypothetical protein LLG08_02130 [Actinomycetia bacterium]|nr:hypothetical protein [Actinomycetes bacterium]
MRQTTRNLVLTGVLCAALLGGTAAFADTMPGNVTFTATIPPIVSVTPTDADTLSVRSNCGWTAEVVTPEGSVTLNGGKTSGTTIELPSNTVAYSVVVSR